MHIMTEDLLKEIISLEEALECYKKAWKISDIPYEINYRIYLAIRDGELGEVQNG